MQQSIQIVPSFIHTHQRDGGLLEGMGRTREDTEHRCLVQLQRGDAPVNGQRADVRRL